VTPRLDADSSCSVSPTTISLLKRPHMDLYRMFTTFEMCCTKPAVNRMNTPPITLVEFEITACSRTHIPSSPKPTIMGMSAPTRSMTFVMVLVCRNLGAAPSARGRGSPEVVARARSLSLLRSPRHRSGHSPPPAHHTVVLARSCVLQPPARTLLNKRHMCVGYQAPGSVHYISIYIHAASSSTLPENML